MTYAARACLALTLLLSLAACAWLTEPQPHATAAERAACRQRVEEVWNKQNPAEVYRSDTYVSSMRDSPYASSGLRLPNAGLSNRYEHDTMVNDCLNNAAGNVGTSAESAAPPRAPQ